MMNLLEEIKKISDNLDAVDSYCDSLADKLSIEDLKQQDLLHLIESEKLSPFECYRIVKKIKEIREVRRNIKNDMEIASAFNSNKSKLVSKVNRQFLIAELHKKYKTLGKKYSNRHYTNQEINEIIKRS